MRISRTFRADSLARLLALVLAAFMARSASAQWTQPNASGHISNTNSGNVGIGTSAPTSKLHVFGDTTVQSGELTVISPNDRAGLILRGGGIFGYAMIGSRDWRVEQGRSASGQFNVTDCSAGCAVRLLVDAFGRVGIGTSTPSQRLHVLGDAAVDGNVVITPPPDNAGLIVRGSGVFGYAMMGSRDWRVEQGRSASGHFNITDCVPNVACHARISVDGAGNVGVGTVQPQAKLHVAGDITVEGNIAAKYQDIAEWVPSSTPIPAGTVVVLDASDARKVVPCTKAYDTRVAGVTSELPGVLLGERRDGDVAVATTGRVRVRVDATAAPIRMGDLLVTSSRPGHAMRSEPVTIGGVSLHRPGTVVGKALEELDGGVGEILVLLSLQ